MNTSPLPIPIPPLATPLIPPPKLPSILQKTCLNPSCQKVFTPGHYGQKQLVCTGAYQEKCDPHRCRGTACRKCAGKGIYENSCKNWYKTYWTQTRKPPRSIPEAEFQVLLDAVAGDAFWKSYLVAARESGLRKGEMLGLTWLDILDGDKIKTVISVRGQWAEGIGFKITKTGQGKLGYLLEESRKALKEHLESCLKEGFWKQKRVWETDESNVWSWFTRLQSRLGIQNPDTGEPYRVHDLRHTAAYRTYKSTGNITKAQELLGHKSPATTSIYAKERPEDFVKSLEDAFKKPKQV